MYFSAKSYPEFKNEDRKYIYQALKHCVNNEGIGYRFWIAISMLLFLVIGWVAYIEPTYLNDYKSDNAIFVGLTAGLIFWLYMLYEVNTSTRRAVKKHIASFEYQPKNT